MPSNNILRRIICSKAANALYWLLICLAILVTMVMFLEAFDADDNDQVSSDKLDFAPMPKGSTLYFNYKNPTTMIKIIDELNHFVHEYKIILNGTFVECGFNLTAPKDHQVCKIDMKTFKPCTEELGYGYPSASPCFLIKMRKVLDWMPEFYDIESLAEAGLSEKYTKFIKDHAKTNPDFLKTIWVECVGKTPMDASLLGDVNYLPSSGFQGFLFPYRNQKRFLEPIIAVHFTNPRTGIVIDIECKVVAKNFRETFSFQLLVDDVKVD